MDQNQREEIMRMTQEYGGAWGSMHTRRLLELIAKIGEGQSYNSEAVWLAAYLHDWGAYRPWAQEGVDHALRSTQVAEELLTQKGFPDDFKELVLECIATHHSGDPNRHLEAILLSDADGLDFLGIVGLLRDVSKNTKELRKALEISRKRREKVPALLCLEKSKEIAAQRLLEMDHLFAAFEAETFGCY